MVQSVKHILEQAISLDYDKRAELVAGILESMTPSHPEIDAAWRVEARARLRAWEAGEIEAEPLEVVRARYLKDRDKA